MSKSFYKEIEEEFEEKFIVKRPDGTYRWLRGIWEEDIHEFLKTSLIKAIEEVKLEKKRMTGGRRREYSSDPLVTDKQWKERQDMVIAYNQATYDLESIKKKLIKSIGIPDNTDSLKL